MSLFNILILICILVFLGFIPTWSHSANWGYGPSGSVVGIIALLIILRIFGII